MCDNPEMIEISVNEYELLKHYKRLWEFYCSKADFEVDSEQYDEDNDKYVADPESEVVIYTNKTLREENDFMNTLEPATDECCDPADMECEDCEHCVCGEACCEESDLDIEVEPVGVPILDEEDE